MVFYKRAVYVSLVCCLANFTLMSAFSVSHKQSILSKRNHIDSGARKEEIACIHMESVAGEYTYISPGSEQVCGLYMIGMENQLVEVTFRDFNIDCEGNGLLAVVDGWEAQGQFFPNEYDSLVPVEDRYRTYCGLDTPPKLFMAAQNVALIQYRIPYPGQGFTLSIRFPKNPQPCNVVSMLRESVYTLRNHGRHINCSISILYPEQLDFLSINVGETNELPRETSETGVNAKCERRVGGDMVEIRSGNGLDPHYMWREGRFCGLSSTPVEPPFLLACQHSVVRLVSSGIYYNSVTFQHKALTAAQLKSIGDIEC